MIKHSLYAQNSKQNGFSKKICTMWTWLRHHFWRLVNYIRDTFNVVVKHNDCKSGLTVTLEETTSQSHTKKMTFVFH